MIAPAYGRHQTTAVGELIREGRRNARGSRGDHDSIEGLLARTPKTAVADLDADQAAEPECRDAH